MSADIIVDSREDSRLFDWLVQQDSLEVVREMLPAGDFWVGGRVLIERKTVTDFVGSIRNRRLWEQLALMNHVNPGGENVVLLEGSLIQVQKVTKWTPRSVAGLLRAVYLKPPDGFGVNMISMPNSWWTLEHLASLARGFREEKKPRHALRAVHRTMPLDKQVEFLLEGLPGIGAEKAKVILQYFGSARKFFKEPERLTELRGFGPRTLEDIVKVLDYEASKGV